MKWSLKKGKHPRLPFGGASRASIHPVRDWLVGLSVAMLVFLGGAAAIAYDFRIQFVLPPEATESTAVTMKYSERDVRHYAERFEARDVEFAKLRGVVVPRADIVSEVPENTEESQPLADQEADGYTTPTLSP
jgi:hypothetical protein